MPPRLPLALCLAALGCAPLAPRPNAAPEGAPPAGAGDAALPGDGAPEPGSFPERWISGGPDCGTEPALQVHAYNRDLYVLRQSLCTSFEAPFLYLIFGDERALLVDTGAGGIAIREAVDGVVDAWLASTGHRSVELVVVHSHGHGDHTAGDPQLAERPGTTLVPATVPALQEFFGIADWPSQVVPYDLGGRVVDVIPIPGHHASHIALYDRRTQLLLTGDSLYPGRLYVIGAVSQGQWPVYQASIERLVDFTEANPVAFVLGAHVEMTNVPGEQLAFRSTHHPNEHPLQLGREHLLELHRALLAMGSTPRVETHDHFVIFPMR